MKNLVELKKKKIQLFFFLVNYKIPRGSKKQNSLPTFPTTSPMMDLDDDDPPDYLPELSEFSRATSDDSAYKS